MELTGAAAFRRSLVSTYRVVPREGIRRRPATVPCVGPGAADLATRCTRRRLGRRWRRRQGTLSSSGRRRRGQGEYPLVSPLSPSDPPHPLILWFCSLAASSVPPLRRPKPLSTLVAGPSVDLPLALASCGRSPASTPRQMRPATEHLWDDAGLITGGRKTGPLYFRFCQLCVGSSPSPNSCSSGSECSGSQLVYHCPLAANLRVWCWPLHNLQLLFESLEFT